jgi:predicted nucleic acid-binding protein
VRLYLDSSVILRVVLGERGRLSEWSRATEVVTSEMTRGIDAVRVNRAVLARAAEPFPTRLRTLDALHVASALLVRARFPALRFATHDADLAAAATAEGLPTAGV